MGNNNFQVIATYLNFLPIYPIYGKIPGTENDNFRIFTYSTLFPRKQAHGHETMNVKYRVN